MSMSTCFSAMIQKTRQPSNTKCQPIQVFNLPNITSTSVPFHKMTHRKSSVLTQMLTWLSVWMSQLIWSIPSWKPDPKKLQEVEEKQDKNSSKKRLKISSQKCPLITMKMKSDNLLRSWVDQKHSVLSASQFLSTFSSHKKLPECKTFSILSERPCLKLVTLLMVKSSWLPTFWIQLMPFSMQEFHQNGFTIQLALKLLGSSQPWPNGLMTWSKETGNFTIGSKAQDHTHSGWVVSSIHKVS